MEQNLLKSTSEGSKVFFHLTRCDYFLLVIDSSHLIIPKHTSKLFLEWGKQLLEYSSQKRGFKNKQHFNQKLNIFIAKLLNKLTYELKNHINFF